MKKCKTCKSKMPEELFVPAFINGKYLKDTCPVCTVKVISEIHGFDYIPQGEIAKDLYDQALEYYKP